MRHNYKFFDFKVGCVFRIGAGCFGNEYTIYRAWVMVNKFVMLGIQSGKPGISEIEIRNAVYKYINSLYLNQIKWSKFDPVWLVSL